MKTLLQVSLDTSQPHEKLVYDILTKQPRDGQKEFLIASVLYYAKSPSYLAEVRMGEYLEQLGKLNAVFADSSLVEVTSRLDELVALKDSMIEQVSAAVLKKLDGIEFSGPARSRKKDKAIADMPEDAVSAMTDAFAT
jgi:hypothetical protein